MNNQIIPDLVDIVRDYLMPSVATVRGWHSILMRDVKIIGQVYPTCHFSLSYDGCSQQKNVYDLCIFINTMAFDKSQLRLRRSLIA